MNTEFQNRRDDKLFAASLLSLSLRAQNNAKENKPIDLAAECFEVAADDFVQQFDC